MKKNTSDKTPAPQRLLASLSFGGERVGIAAEQIRLLQAIDDSGSISAAAKVVGISYKTAWERVDAMNNLSGRALVDRSTGGAGGGGTRLTDFGRQTVQGFLALVEEHQSYLQRLANKVQSVEDLASFVDIGTVKTSARNQLRGKIVTIGEGATNNLVQVQVSSEVMLTVVMTRESAIAMGVQEGLNCIALIKASSVLVAKDLTLQLSARNCLTGRIQRITLGSVNSDVVVDLGGSKSLCANISNDSVSELSLSVGDTVNTYIKASSIILLLE